MLIFVTYYFSMENTHFITTENLDLTSLNNLFFYNKKLLLSEEVKMKITTCRMFLDEKLKESEEPIYGINTGFGSLYNVKVDKPQLAQLQENLVMSHACGTGEEVPQEIVKIMFFLKIQSLCYGFSAVQLDTVQRLVDFYNNDVFPVVYTQGSLGASGDLSPLAHLSLPLLGKGEVYVEGKRMKSAKALKRFGWEALKLRSKEGLALLNGTQFMSAYGLHLVLKSYKLSYLADLIGTISLEAFDGRKEPFCHLTHDIRPHNGQVKTAERINQFLQNSDLINQPKTHVQDPYSFRCMPQVHGATKDALSFVAKTILTEVNAVTDNPNVFAEDNLIISGGNFHGQPLALALDFLGIAMAELGSISERRTYQLISGLRGLPAFLISNPGLNSGFMIPQYTAASIVSQNKQLATPASVDSIVSSNGQEDHVSMGANAATKAKKIVDNIETIFAIELMNASQGLSFRKPIQSSPFIESFVEMFRSEVPLVENDRVLHDDIVNATTFIKYLTIDTEELFEV